MKEKIEIVDRYSATGIPRPDANSCEECEGMGVYPTSEKELNKQACASPTGKLIIIGQKERDGSPMEDDGYLFVQCPYCNGTRKKTSI